MTVNAQWKQQASMKTLGHHLDDDAGIKTCFNKTTASMWRSFYGNLSEGLLTSNETTKLRFLNTSIATIPSFRWARWPYQES